MKLLFAPTMLPGAEMIEYKGEYGVFIPLDCNGTMSKPKGRLKSQMFINLYGKRNFDKRKQCTDMFSPIPPSTAKDRFLETRGQKATTSPVAWTYRTNKKETGDSPVSSQDFIDLLGL